MFFSGKCKRLHTYIIRSFIPCQTFKLSAKALHSKNFKRPIFFRTPQIFSLEISGPNVVLVLLCKFSFVPGGPVPYRGPGPKLKSQPWCFSLTRWSGPVGKLTVQQFPPSVSSVARNTSPVSQPVGTIVTSSLLFVGSRPLFIRLSLFIYSGIDILEFYCMIYFHICSFGAIISCWMCLIFHTQSGSRDNCSEIFKGLPGTQV